MSALKSIGLRRLVGVDAPDAAEKLSAMMSKYNLVEWLVPEAEPVPEDHDGTKPLTLGQLRTHMREKYKATIRVYVRPARVKGGRHGVWFVFAMRGYLWYGDATDAIEQLDWDAAITK